MLQKTYITLLFLLVASSAFAQQTPFIQERWILPVHLISQPE